MIYSMTGYAVASMDTLIGTLTLELRAVNHRFLDAQFRLPEEWRQFEPALREKLAAALSRGKAECRLSITPRAETHPTLNLNTPLLTGLLGAEQHVLSLAKNARGLSVADILRWPGILAAERLDDTALSASLFTLFDQVLGDFLSSRAREGEKLVALLLDRIAGIEAIAAATAPKVPMMVAAFETKFAERLAEAFTVADPARLQQEVALYAQKVDIAEELGRLTAHCSETRRILQKGGAVGKRLDFLLQELGREANTLGSKASSFDLAQTAVELKVLIEQIREQVQNIE